MYDEFERAVTGKNGARLSFLGWFSIAVGTLFALGIVAAALTYVRVKSEIAEVIEVIEHQIEARPTMAADAMVERLASHTALLNVQPEEGVTLLQDLGEGSPSEAFMEDFFGGTMELFPEGKEIVEDLKETAREGLMELKGAEGDISMDLIRGDDGGSLVIETGDGQVRFDLKKTTDGGFLTIDSEDSQVRFDLIKGDDGGSLVINSDDGEVRFDVQGGENGGTMVVRTEDSTLRFGAGDEAERMPGWVERMDGMPSRPQPVYSLESEDSFMGAVAWEDHGSARDVLSFYRGDCRQRPRQSDGADG